RDRHSWACSDVTPGLSRPNPQKLGLPRVNQRWLGAEAIGRKTSTGLNGSRKASDSTPITRCGRPSSVTERPKTLESAPNRVFHAAADRSTTRWPLPGAVSSGPNRSEEHTSELQSR